MSDVCFAHGPSHCSSFITHVVQVFYTTTARASEVKGHWCHACYSEARDGLTQMDGSTVRKADLNKRKNDEEVSFMMSRLACLVAARLTAVVIVHAAPLVVMNL